MALQLKKKEVSTGTKWVDFDEDTKVELVGIDDQAYQIALERMRRRLRNNDAKFKDGEVGVFDGEKTEHQCQCLLLAQFIVKDWSGVQDEDGNPLKYAHDTGARLLEDDIEFFLFVIRESGKIAAEARGDLEETLGKSSADSNGSESGAEKPKSGRRSTKA